MRPASGPFNGRGLFRPQVGRAIDRGLWIPVPVGRQRAAIRARAITRHGLGNARGRVCAAASRCSGDVSNLCARSRGPDSCRSREARNRTATRPKPGIEPATRPKPVDPGLIRVLLLLARAEFGDLEGRRAGFEGLVAFFPAEDDVTFARSARDVHDQGSNAGHFESE